MLIFLLILLVIAALLGILGAIIKVTLILVFSVILAVVILGAVLWFVAKNRMKKFRATLRSYDAPRAGDGGSGGSGGPQSSGSTIEVHGYIVGDSAKPPEEEPPRLGE